MAPLIVEVKLWFSFFFVHFTLCTYEYRQFLKFSIWHPFKSKSAQRYGLLHHLINVHLVSNIQVHLLGVIASAIADVFNGLDDEVFIVAANYWF